MPKSIKVSEEVYLDLDEIRGKGETFSQAVDRLLDLRRMLLAVDPILRGQRAYQEWKDAREDAIHKATLERVDLDNRTLKRPLLK